MYLVTPRFERLEAKEFVIVIGQREFNLILECGFVERVCF